MPNDRELKKLKVVGARVERLIGGWQTTLIREGEHCELYEETFPLRSKELLAFEDIERESPDMLRYAIVNIKMME